MNLTKLAIAALLTQVSGIIVAQPNSESVQSGFRCTESNTGYDPGME
jgi:hypothetical protein